jgi:hypothetical protein
MDEETDDFFDENLPFAQIHSTPLAAYSSDHLNEEHITEEETDVFMEDSAHLFARSRIGSMRPSISIRGGIGSIRESRPLTEENEEDLNQDNVQLAKTTTSHSRRRGSVMSNFSRKASVITSEDQEQIILQQVLAKRAGKGEGIESKGTVKKDSLKNNKKTTSNKPPVTTRVSLF